MTPEEDARATQSREWRAARAARHIRSKRATMPDKPNSEQTTALPPASPSSHVLSREFILQPPQSSIALIASRLQTAVGNSSLHRAVWFLHVSTVLESAGGGESGNLDEAESSLLELIERRGIVAHTRRVDQPTVGG